MPNLFDAGILRFFHYSWPHKIRWRQDKVLAPNNCLQNLRIHSTLHCFSFNNLWTIVQLGWPISVKAHVYMSSAILAGQALVSQKDKGIPPESLLLSVAIISPMYYCYVLQQMAGYRWGPWERQNLTTIYLNFYKGHYYLFYKYKHILCTICRNVSINSQ